MFEISTSFLSDPIPHSQICRGCSPSSFFLFKQIVEVLSGSVLGDPLRQIRSRCDIWLKFFWNGGQFHLSKQVEVKLDRLKLTKELHQSAVFIRLRTSGRFFVISTR